MFVHHIACDSINFMCSNCIYFKDVLMSISGFNTDMYF